MDRWAARISPIKDSAWECAKAIERYLKQRPDMEDVEYKADDGYKSVFFSCATGDPLSLHLMIEKHLDEVGVASDPLVKVERVDGKGKI